MRPLLAVGILLVACGGRPQDGNTLPPEKLSATEHEMAAMEHEREAAAHDREARTRDEADPGADQRCFDEAVPSMTYSGGEKLEMLRPCWTALTSPEAREKAEAKRHREIAAKHRARAKKLRDAEAEHCAGFGAAELSQTPFANRRDILSVAELPDGVRVVFRKVPGLTAEWMESALGCHTARAAVLGYPEKFMAYCPAVLPDLRIDVSTSDEGVVVELHSKRSEIAAAALGRARDLRREPVEDAASP